MAQLASLDEIAKFRKPKEIYTQAYLDDPIKFTTDLRLTPETLIRQVQDFPTVNRDFAQFVSLNLSATGSQFYPVSMYTSALNRADYTRHIDRTIKQLLPK
jgi:hypothetical protein